MVFRANPTFGSIHCLGRSRNVLNTSRSVASHRYISFRCRLGCFLHLGMCSMLGRSALLDRGGIRCGEAVGIIERFFGVCPVLVGAVSLRSLLSLRGRTFHGSRWRVLARVFGSRLGFRRCWEGEKQSWPMQLALGRIILRWIGFGLLRGQGQSSLLKVQGGLTGRWGVFSRCHCPLRLGCELPFLHFGVLTFRWVRRGKGVAAFFGRRGIVNAVVRTFGHRRERIGFHRYITQLVVIGCAMIRRRIARSSRRNVRSVSRLRMFGLLQIAARSCTLLCI